MAACPDCRRLEEKIRILEDLFLRVKQTEGAIQFVLPADCKVFRVEDRLVITAPAPKKTREEDRDEVGRRIWLKMVPNPADSGKSWKETGTGKTALLYADAVVRFRGEG